eukprot:TRINITY_DN118_c0_g1_i2.p1 TRINITY_DN118_c0_g1~~TRINITY_DN118_c0_g1_i2.p1  ORF type:complete len:286 (-),score=87.12 TRINITY_DN118_c0_g1_i2:47-883(-)
MSDAALVEDGDDFAQAAAAPAATFDAAQQADSGFGSAAPTDFGASSDFGFSSSAPAQDFSAPAAESDFGFSAPAPAPAEAAPAADFGSGFAAAPADSGFGGGFEASEPAPASDFGFSASADSGFGFASAPAPAPAPVPAPAPAVADRSEPVTFGFGDPDQKSSFIPTLSSANELTPLQKFNTKRRAQLEEQDAASEKRRRELTEQAKQALAAFYQEREQKIAGSKSQNRVEQQTFLAANADTSANQWERVVRLVDLEQKPDRKDISRFRQVLLQVKSA